MRNTFEKCPLNQKSSISILYFSAPPSGPLIFEGGFLLWWVPLDSVKVNVPSFGMQGESDQSVINQLAPDETSIYIPSRFLAKNSFFSFLQFVIVAVPLQFCGDVPMRIINACPKCISCNIESTSHIIHLPITAYYRCMTSPAGGPDTILVFIN